MERPVRVAPTRNVRSAAVRIAGIGVGRAAPAPSSRMRSPSDAAGFGAGDAAATGVFGIGVGGTSAGGARTCVTAPTSVIAAGSCRIPE